MVPTTDHSTPERTLSLSDIRPICIQAYWVHHRCFGFVNSYSDSEVGNLYLCYYNHLKPFNGLFSRTTWVRRYQKGKTNLDFTGARDSEWQWHQLGHMHVCTSLQTDNHASTPPLCFLPAGCPSCRPTNSVKALKALAQ